MAPRADQLDMLYVRNASVPLVVAVLLGVLMSVPAHADATGSKRALSARADTARHAGTRPQRPARSTRRTRARRGRSGIAVRRSEPSPFVLTRVTGPARTVVSDRSGSLLATFTDGARTVTLRGPSRTFAERTAAAPVTSTTWVRVLPRPFARMVDETWLRAALADTSPDVLAIAVQYIEGAPPVLDANGRRVAGDASYGPLQEDGTRQEGSDFNDYLGTTMTYGTTVDGPEPAQLGSLDCSGFTRMVWGVRSGVPLGLDPDGGASLPRRAVQMLASAPGVVTVPDTGRQVTAVGSLAPGDLVFFDVAGDDGPQVDHVGTFLGHDTAGHLRFISSRKTIDGPTLGDEGGRSILDGTGLYATGFRAVRRL